MEISWTWADLPVPYARGCGGNARGSNWGGIRRARWRPRPGEAPHKLLKTLTHAAHGRASVEMSATQRPISSILQEKATIQHWSRHLSLPISASTASLNPQAHYSRGKEGGVKEETKLSTSQDKIPDRETKLSGTFMWLLAGGFSSLSYGRLFRFLMTWQLASSRASNERQWERERERGEREERTQSVII